MGQRIPEGGAIASPQADATCSASERMFLQYGEHSTGILVAVPLVIFPQPPTPHSPQVFLVHCILPLLEPRVSSWRWNFVIWLFKSLSASLLSLPGRQKPCCFWQLVVISVLFWLRCYRMGRPACGLDATLLRGTPPPVAEISLQHFSCYPWEPSQPSCISSALPTSLIVVKWFPLSVLGYTI